MTSPPSASAATLAAAVQYVHTAIAQSFSDVNSTRVDAENKLKLCPFEPRCGVVLATLLFGYLQAIALRPDIIEGALGKIKASRRRAANWG